MNEHTERERKSPSILILSGAVVCILALSAGCSDRPVLLDSQGAISPDSKWQATIKHVEDGLGGGFHEIHVHAPNAEIPAYGEPDSTVIFYFRSEQRNYGRPSVEWLDTRRLRIKYPSLSRPGRMVAKFNDIDVEYQKLALPPSCADAIL